MLLFAGLAGWLVALTGVQLTGPAVAAGLVGALVAVVGGCLVAGREHTELRAYLGAAAVVAIAFVGMGLAGGGVLEGGARFVNALLVRIGERTLDYALPYRAGDDGALVAFCALAGAAGGLVCSLLAQRGVVAPVLVLAVGAVAGVVSGWVPVGLWAFFLAAGVVTCLAARSSLLNDVNTSSSLPWALACAVTACVLVGCGVGVATQGNEVDTSNANGAIARALWNMEYGDASFAMPDGQLEGLGPLKQSNQQAMSVTVDKPTYEYLRGFVGGAYRGDAWVPLGSEAVMQNRDLLYWLDRDGLVGNSQLVTANRLVELDDADDAHFEQTLHSVRKPYAYLPYGYGGGSSAHATTDLSQMRVEGSPSQALTFNPNIVRRAYLLQDAVDGAQVGKGRRAASEGQSSKSDAAAPASSSDADSDSQVGGQADQLRMYLDDNAAYREFAKAQYCAIPDDVAELFGKLYGPAVKLTTEQAKIQVLALLDDTVAYSDNPKASDGEDVGEGASGASASATAASKGASSASASALNGQTSLDSDDFVTQFLAGDRAGYSVHYATAAALLMRYYGVPTRYVEGYVFNTTALDRIAANGGEGEDDAQNEVSTDGSQAGASAGSGEDKAAPFLGTYTLTERQAHAWVEYYLDGVGWVPFDVTPGWRNAGFYETTDDAQLVDDSQNWSVGEADEDTVWTPPEPEEEEAEEESDNPAPMFGEMEFIFVLWPWVLAGFLLTMYLAFFVRGSILRKRLRRFLSQASDESVAPADAVPALFSYLVMLVQTCGGAPLANAPYAAQATALEAAGLCPAEQFERAARANDRVLFADGSAQVDRDDALAVFECVKSVQAGLKNQVSPLRRFWQRDVRCLW